MCAAPISHYGLIGNLRCAALVSREGSIDWFCPPRFDAPACFTALLGSSDHGRWLIAPTEKTVNIERSYRQNSLVLETRFRTESGEISVTDFMPLHSGCFLVRMVRGLRGRVPVSMECAPRFDYGRNYPHLQQGDNAFHFRNGSTALVLHAKPLAACVECVDEHKVRAELTVGEGEEYWFTLEHIEEGAQMSTSMDIPEAQEHCEQWWRNWVAHCGYQGQWRDSVVRSLITIKALIYEPSGGMVAAPTTSLPEYLGGAANWDYRFCWLRDAALALDVLLDCNYMDEAYHWRNWLQKAARIHPGPLRPLYTIDAELPGEEKILDWLPGYRDSKPVRAGNAASRQYQMDVRGELMDVLHVARARSLEVEPRMWQLQCQVLEHLARCWHEPDAGFWEFRGDYVQLTLSKIMAWVAFDRSIRDAERYGLSGPLASWRSVREEIRAEVLSKGISSDGSYFTERYGSDQVDASLLMIPLVEFLPASDPRVKNTVAMVERHLCHEGLVYRHRTGDPRSWYDKEGAFLLCSFWLVDNYWLAGRRREAQALFERLLALCNDVGLLAEEYDPECGMFLGNFPQTLSHLGLINSARLLSGADVLRCG